MNWVIWVFFMPAVPPENDTGVFVCREEEVWIGKYRDVNQKLIQMFGVCVCRWGGVGHILGTSIDSQSRLDVSLALSFV